MELLKVFDHRLQRGIYGRRARSPRRDILQFNSQQHEAWQASAQGARHPYGFVQSPSVAGDCSERPGHNIGGGQGNQVESPGRRTGLDSIQEQDQVGAGKELQQPQVIVRQFPAFAIEAAAHLQAMHDFQPHTIVAGEWIATTHNQQARRY